MDFMKVFDQTVREIKREVNLKVLKVPEIEQKVLDATDNEPWGPHGSALAEIAQATKKFAECQMVMNVLWTRIGETGKDWRYVYKALTVIEYLVAHGSERAVDEIIEHTFQISSLSSFEYVEPSGKDMGINVRKKAETIGALLNNKDKIQEVREKAAANRDKYFGLSSTGVTYKGGPASSYSSGSYQSSDRYGGLTSSRDGDRYRDQYDEEKIEKDTYTKSRHGANSENQGSTLRKARKDRSSTSSFSKPTTKSDDSDKYSSIPSQSTNLNLNNYEDDFDDFDPRGTSTTKSAGSSNQVDLFGESLIGDLMDTPTSVPAENPAMNSSSSEVDLFADSTFVSAPPVVGTKQSSQIKNDVDLFASQPAISSTASSTVDLFTTSDAFSQPEVKSTNTTSTNNSVDPFAAVPEIKSTNTTLTNNNVVDPFAAVPLNNFDDSDLFGSFTSHSEPSQNSNGSGSNNNNLGGNLLPDSKTPAKKDPFGVKSGIWADSLSRGLIDLNISAPKKVNLADVGIVGGLSDGTNEKEKGPPTSFYMGRAMGSGSGLGKSGSGFTSSQQQAIGDDFFSSPGGPQYQYGGFQK